MSQVINPANTEVAKVFVVCDDTDTGAVWGYILRQHGLVVIPETSPEHAVDHWSAEITDVVVIDMDVAPEDLLGLCRSFREVSVAPLLVLLSAPHETQILEAYKAGADEVVLKPVSPAIFLAKALAWVRRSWTVPIAQLSPVQAGRHGLDPSRRSLISHGGVEVRLTNLEFRLLLLLMSRSGHTFSAEEIIESIWGEYGSGDHSLLKNVVYRLRRKIEPDPAHPKLLQTGPGGYSFVD